MANNIIITKLSNGNINVDNGINEFKLTGEMLVYKDVEKDSCIIKGQSGSVVETFKVDDVLKVVRADATEIFITDLDTFYSELNTFFFFKLNGFSPNHRHLGNFTNYTDLITQFPMAEIGNLAYVENSQGTAWLPGGLGGTFFSKGHYLWNGADWDSAVDEIAKALEDLFLLTKGIGLISGVITGGEISVNVDPAKGDVASGTGWIANYTNPLTPIFNDVEWDEVIGLVLPALGAAPFSSIFVTASNTVTATTGAALTNEEIRNNVVLDTFVHVDGLVINDIAITSIQAYQSQMAIIDWANRIGTVNEGNTVIAEGTGTQVRKIAGTTSIPWINRQINTQDPSVKINDEQLHINPFVSSHRDGVGGYIFVTGNSAIDTTMWDNDGLTSTLNSKFYVSRGLFFSQTETYHFTYPQAEYNSFSDAIQAIFSENPDLSPLLASGNFLTAVIFKGNSTLFTDSDQVVFENIISQNITQSSITPNWVTVVQGIANITHNNDFLLTPSFSSEPGFIYRVGITPKATLGVTMFSEHLGTNFDDGIGYYYGSTAILITGDIEARGRYNDGSAMGASDDFYYKVEKSFVGVI